MQNSKILVIGSKQKIDNISDYDFTYIDYKDYKKSLLADYAFSAIILSTEDRNYCFNLLGLIKGDPSLRQYTVILMSSEFSKIAKMKSFLFNADAFLKYEEMNSKLLTDVIRGNSEIEQNFLLEGTSNFRDKDYLNKILMNEKMLNLLLNCSDIHEAAFSILKMINLFYTVDIAVLIINFKELSKAFIDRGDFCSNRAMNDFFRFCQHDHYSSFNHVSIDSVEKIFSERAAKQSSAVKTYGEKLINSYYYVPVKNYKQETIATIHLGNFSNNYFSNEKNNTILHQLITKTGVVIDTINKIHFASSKRKDLKNLFSKFVPPEIIDEMIKTGSMRRKNERKKIAVLFSDIRSFTTITEDNAPDTVISFLNIYFDEMVKCIKKYGGTIDKYIGDAIVAVFGIYGDNDMAPLNAVKASSEMMEKQRALNPENINLPNGNFGIGIGIHYGESIVGNIGSEEKTAYTIVGKISGIAEELESMTKHTASILFSQSVAEKISDSEISFSKIRFDEELNINIYSIDREINIAKNAGKSI